MNLLAPYARTPRDGSAYEETNCVNRVLRGGSWGYGVVDHRAAQRNGGLTAYVRDRSGYDYHHHAEVGSANAAFVDDESVDRFCVVGEAAEQVARLRELAAVGVGQFNLYLMNGDEEETVERYGRDVIPAMRAAAD